MKEGIAFKAAKMLQESEHDQLVRLKELVKIFKEWLPTQHYHSGVDEYQAWEELKNETYQKVEDHFDFVFGLKNTSHEAEAKKA